MFHLFKSLLCCLSFHSRCSFRLWGMRTLIWGRLPCTWEYHSDTRHTDNITKSSQSLRCIPPSRNGGTTKYDTTRRTWCVHNMLVSKRIDVWTVPWCSVERWRTEGTIWYKLPLGGEWTFLKFLQQLNFLSDTTQWICVYFCPISIYPSRSRGHWVDIAVYPSLSCCLFESILRSIRVRSKSDAIVRQVSPCPPSVRQVSARPKKPPPMIVRLVSAKCPPSVRTT